MTTYVHDIPNYAAMSSHLLKTQCSKFVSVDTSYVTRNGLSGIDNGWLDAGNALLETI